MNDILLTDDGDLYITEQGDIVLTESVSQAIRIRLRWFLNEWKFNPALGIPYFEEVLIKNASTFRIEQLITEQILAVEGVTSVESVKITVSREDRTAGITFRAYAGSEYIEDEVSNYA